tara:strand:+ start:416 stop:697 length:282 start_codon:yes stop_codon:yes gene_type:complete
MLNEEWMPARCLDCDRDTSFGSGLFINRVSTDGGWLCAECAALCCDRCGDPIALGEDITPADVFGDERAYFYDNCYRICEGCLNFEESKAFNT